MDTKKEKTHMTLNDLKKMVDNLVNQGYGTCELRMDTDRQRPFDIEFIEYRYSLGELCVGVRTNDNPYRTR
jgi:hypothetical protein